MNKTIISDLFLLGSSGLTPMTSKLHFDMPVPYWDPVLFQEVTKPEFNEGEMKNFLHDIMRSMLLLRYHEIDVTANFVD